jgi:hypothetical protein
MKIVINKCYGGFSLSPKAVQRIAELEGRPCHFFVASRYAHLRNLTAPEGKHWVPVTPTQAADAFVWTAFDVPNPDDVIPSQENWHEMTQEQRDASSAAYHQHQIDGRPDKRDDPLLVQVVEELGAAASGSCADLKVVEVPDGVDWTIDEYDGNEWVAERHRTWS